MAKINDKTKELLTKRECIYFSDGVMEQFKREFEHTGKWTYEAIIAVAKMFFDGEGAPRYGVCLCGSKVLDGIRKIDWSTHPDVTAGDGFNDDMEWKVFVIHTVFGDLQFKYDRDLDIIGCSNSFGIFDRENLVHLVYKGEHGKMLENGNVALYDALALEGSRHLWVNGDNHSQ